MARSIGIMAITAAFLVQLGDVWGAGQGRDALATTEEGARKHLAIEGQKAVVVVDLAGGSMADFHLKSNPVNPFTWGYPSGSDIAPRSMGHFICFDRWGPASEAETKNGMGWHGEATRVNWRIVEQPDVADGRVKAAVECELPMAGMKMRRTLALDDAGSVLHVTEAATNMNKLGRLYNLVQHATIGPPFLDESTMIDTNAAKGFSQDGQIPTIEKEPSQWPRFSYKGQEYDMRHLGGEPGPEVTSFVFDENQTYGWVTASSPDKGVLVGYFWKLADYPWLNLWRNCARGKPAAYGMEFGSTGLHQPFKVLVQKREIFGRQLYEYIDAGETISKSYTAFLVEIPKDYRGVAAIDIKEGEITLKERDAGEKRNIIVEIIYNMGSH